MEDLENQRPDPDALLRSICREEKSRAGRLKIFFGYSAGVGKTYSMLGDAHDLLKHGVDVIVGYVEPHTRPETMRLLEGLPCMPPQVLPYKNIELKEFDLDAALKRHPEVILVDELAHTNAPGARNKKRYQDVEELLNAGIDVYTTVNVQHIESLIDIVQNITNVNVRETVPDYIFDNADKVELIDIGADELLRRFREGKVYSPDRARAAMHNFFTKENLRLLRELAMRSTADWLGSANQNEPQIVEKSTNIKLLVCISPSPSSTKCIRWTERTAKAFHAPWVAVYVEDMHSHTLSDEQKKNVRTNLDLAEQLGAEIATLNGNDIATVIAEYAKLSGITNIVVGKSRRKKSFWSYFEADLEDKLMSMLSTVEVHIIPDASNVQKSFRKPPKVRLGRGLLFSWRDFWMMIGILAAATLLSEGLRALTIADQNIIMAYILSVLIISRITTGYLFGIIASILSVLAFNFFFTEPYFTLNAYQPGYPVTFAIMFFVAFLTSALTSTVKAQALIAVSRERRTEVLYEINKKLLATRGIENIVALTNEYLIALFDRSVIFYVDDPADSAAEYFVQSPAELDASAMKGEDERAVAHWVFVNQKRAGAGTDTLMGAIAFYMPVISQGIVLGVFGLSCFKGKVDHKDRLFLRMIASLVALALERQALSDEQRQMTIQSEKEKVRSNLLRAISHDLRTPLTCILGASSAVLENGDSLDHETRDKLIGDIKEDSQWLIRMVENILSVTRIDEGTMNVIKKPEVVEEILAEAVSRIHKRFGNRKISVKVPDELLIVPMDGTLIEQVLINLIENAIKHSPDDSVIHVSVTKSGQEAIFEVVDHGSGIAVEALPHLFENYIMNGGQSPDASRGMGIGLSICMSIIKAHHGGMEANNNPEGGAVFKFTLPLEEEREYAG